MKILISVIVCQLGGYYWFVKCLETTKSNHHWLIEMLRWILLVCEMLIV